MGFDKNWEDIFCSRSWGKYPAEDVIRFVARNFFRVTDRASVRILDLGCGGGANTWFLAREGFSVSAIDGSPSAIEQARSLLKEERLTADFRLGDINVLNFPDEHFDAVIDANAIQQNVWADIQQIHNEIFRILKPGGLLFGMQLAIGTTGPESGEWVEANTYVNCKTGFVTSKVLAHFFDRGEIEQLLSRYQNVTLGQLLRTEGELKICHFLVSAQKPVSE